MGTPSRRPSLGFTCYCFVTFCYFLLARGVQLLVSTGHGLVRQDNESGMVYGRTERRWSFGVCGRTAVFSFYCARQLQGGGYKSSSRWHRHLYEQGYRTKGGRNEKPIAANHAISMPLVQHDVRGLSVLPLPRHCHPTLAHLALEGRRRYNGLHNGAQNAGHEGLGTESTESHPAVGGV